MRALVYVFFFTAAVRGFPPRHLLQRGRTIWSIRAVSIGGMSISGPRSPRQQPVSTVVDAKEELEQLKARLGKLEQQWAQAVLVADTDNEQNSSGAEYMPALVLPSKATTLVTSARAMEVCASVAFFCIGCVLGASLFDRLALVGGSAAAWWATGAVTRDTRGGALCRRLGRQLATVLGQLVAKWEEAVVFYKTGQLAFVGKAQYEKMDRRFGVEKKMLEFKKLGMARVAELGQREIRLRDKLQDAVTVLRRGVEDPALGKTVGATLGRARLRGQRLWSSTLSRLWGALPTPPSSPSSSSSNNNKNNKKAAPKTRRGSGSKSDRR